MLETIAVSLALLLPASNFDRPSRLESIEICRLAKENGFSSDTVYSISGKYVTDGIHLTLFELPACSAILWPVIESDAAAKIDAFYKTFHDKCGVSYVMNPSFSGVFTGKIVIKEISFQGRPAVPENIFHISNIESDDLDLKSIKCPK